MEKTLHRNKKGIVGRVLLYTVLIVGAVIAIFPFFWMVLTAFKSSAESMQIPVTFIPKEWITTNFSSIVQKLPFFKIYLNTIINAAVIVVAQISLCALAGYAYARIDFPCKNVLFTITLSVLMVPGTFFILPQYRIIYKLGLINTIPGLFLPSLFSAMGIFLLRQFFLSLPAELEDAAYIDGCNRGKTFLYIMLPLVKPGLVSLGILTFRYAWNDLMWPLIVNTSQDKMTLSAALSYLQGQYVTDYPGVMAGALLSVVPMIVLFAIFQKQFVEGVAHTGIKG